MIERLENWLLGGKLALELRAGLRLLETDLELVHPGRHIAHLQRPDSVPLNFRDRHRISGVAATPRCPKQGFHKCVPDIRPIATAKFTIRRPT